MFSDVRALLEVSTGRFLKLLWMDGRVGPEGASGGPESSLLLQAGS